MAEVDLLDFLKDCKRLACWRHLVIHRYRLKDDHSYRETENRLWCFSEGREILELNLNDVLDHTMIYKSFDRFNVMVWRELLRIEWSA